MPYLETIEENKKIDLINDTFRLLGIKPQYAGFNAPKNKQATYAQCSRLYGACLDLPEDEILVTSDIDMAVFTNPPVIDGFAIFGGDLVPQEQYPMCYISAKVKDWRKAFNLHGKTYQQCLDETIGKEECENMRGNLWCRDQETAYNVISKQSSCIFKRASPNTQFATHRVDRDDFFWRDRISNQLVDAHLWRPGYEPQNFANILELMQTMYPYEDFQWLIDYTEQYTKLL
jgi:hypothetical protein